MEKRSRRLEHGREAAQHRLVARRRGRRRQARRACIMRIVWRSSATGSASGKGRYRGGAVQLFIHGSHIACDMSDERAHACVARV